MDAWKQEHVLSEEDADRLKSSLWLSKFDCIRLPRYSFWIAGLSLAIYTLCGYTRKLSYWKRGRPSSYRGAETPSTVFTVFERHFTDFCSRYEDEYADTFGKFRLKRIQALGEHFLTCGDYRQGIARIRCTNPDCAHDYFRPFSCKGFYLYPSGRMLAPVGEPGHVCSLKSTR
jgi:hypothetical protein